MAGVPNGLGCVNSRLSKGAENWAFFHELAVTLWSTEAVFRIVTILGHFCGHSTFFRLQLPHPNRSSDKIDMYIIYIDRIG